MQLKANRPDPDLQAVKTVEESETEGNHVPQDILKRLPGVNRGNLRPLTEQVESLHALSHTPTAELEKIMGGRANAERLVAFINQDQRGNVAASANKH